MIMEAALCPLQQALRPLVEAALLPLISGHDQHICLLDPPGYSNVGDHAILLGELAFLRRHFPHARLSFFDIGNYTDHCDAFIEQCSIILMNGGGNFGDLWAPHHDLRLRILDRFRHKRIVQLPQSISFKDPACIAQTRAAIAGHDDFHLVVRDHASAEFARINFDCPVILSPDMAFCLDPLIRARAVIDYFCLLRTDKEVAADHDQLLSVLAKKSDHFEVDDWIIETPDRVKRLDRYLLRRSLVHPGLAWVFNNPILNVRERYARRRLDVGIAMLSRGQVVVTDRLHGHILSCLLGIPNYVFNSIDGKVAAFHTAWTHLDPQARRVDSVSEFREMLHPGVAQGAIVAAGMAA
jgi:exopolysaccharide biosynthesis predicted pyruvyltransferase EpsI